MWGTSSPVDEFTGDLGDAIEATQIAGRRLVCLVAGNLSPGQFWTFATQSAISDRMHCGKQPWGWRNSRRSFITLSAFIERSRAELRENVMAVTP
jgi:hypothetical protein